MRILQVCTNFPMGGGIQRHVADLSHYLNLNDHLVYWAGSYGELVDVSDVDFLDIPAFEVTVDGGTMFRRISALVLCARKLRKYLKLNNIDVIHAHETAPAIISKLAAIGTGIPLVMTYHGSQPEREKEAARIARYTSDITLCPSHTSLAKLISYGLPKEHARVMGLGIHPPVKISQEKISKLRKRYSDDEHEIIVFSLSRLSHQKGIDVMIDVVKALVDRGVKVRFIVAGGGPLWPEVEQWAINAKVQNYIHFIGHTNEVSEHLAAADIFLLTSRWEALPISIVEAFKTGIPVIATDCGGVRELVDDKVGQLCTVEDVEGLTAALRALIENTELRKQKGQAAQKRGLKERFDPDYIHSTFIELYRELSNN